MSYNKNSKGELWSEYFQKYEKKCLLKDSIEINKAQISTIMVILKHSKSLFY